MARKIEGTVIAISDSGNLVTSITAAQLIEVPRGSEAVNIICDEHETLGIFDLEHQEPPMTLLALVGNSGNLELEIVGDSAKIMLGVRVGEKVVVKW
ncbi:MAG TPA: SAM hydroxide adenosyltransferase [Pirellulaceae bacterium]|nr:SAM hydroxide adenosyltransferase [Pirellulaceae bacterium]